MTHSPTELRRYEDAQPIVRYFFGVADPVICRRADVRLAPASGFTAPSERTDPWVCNRSRLGLSASEVAHFSLSARKVTSGSRDGMVAGIECGLPDPSKDPGKDPCVAQVAHMTEERDPADSGNGKRVSGVNMIVPPEELEALEQLQLQRSAGGQGSAVALGIIGGLEADFLRSPGLSIHRDLVWCFRRGGRCLRAGNFHGRYIATESERGWSNGSLRRDGDGHWPLRTRRNGGFL